MIADPVAAIVAVDVSTLGVSPPDAYVSARSGPLRTELAAYIEDVSSFADLVRAIEMLFPAAARIERLDWTGVQRLMRDMIGPEIVAAIAKQFRLPEHQAIGNIVRHCGALCPDALAPLRAVPPETIHAMQRGPYWIGDPHAPGIVMAALGRLGVPVAGRFLDYGCSSGSMARMMAACFPDLQVTGTDPVASSIAWARENLKLANLAFDDQDQQPPLPFDDETFDVIAANSIFSHHGPSAARRWFAEIARVLKPGGHFVFTAHGAGAVLRHASVPDLPFKQIKALLLELSSVGHAFLQPWGGDDGTGNLTALEWGVSYYLPSTVVALMHPALEQLSFASRGSQGCQDVYVARRTR